MRMQETVCVGNSYKYMYENCAGGLLDALVIVQYMHVIYIYIYIYTWGPPRVKVRGGAKEVGLSVRLECYQ